MLFVLVKHQLTAFRRGFSRFAQNSLPLLLESVPESPNPPSLLITGATASVKGSALFGSFAAGKFALRALGQSLAREFGPQGVHVAHIIVDGIIDIPRTKHFTTASSAEDAKLKPEAVGFITSNYHMIKKLTAHL